MVSRMHLRAVLFATTLASTLAKADGQPDATFGVGGSTTVDFGGFDEASAVVAQADGKLVQIGAADLSGLVGAVARYLPDGSLDPSFGIGGKRTISFGFFDGGFTTGALQSDGKIVAAGAVWLPGDTSSIQWLVARLLPNGDLDQTFGDGGMTVTAIGSGYGTTFALVIQPNGKIVAAGYATIEGYDVVLARYNSDGSLDSAFGSNGLVVNDVFEGSTDVAWALALQHGGKIVVAGRTRGHDTCMLLRYKEDGTLDQSFGSGGVVTTAFGGSDEGFNAIAIQQNGKIVLGGSTDRGGAKHFFVARYTHNGALDATFGVGGAAHLPLAATSYGVQSLALQSDGRIIVAGLTDNLGETRAWAIARLNSNGSLDDGSAGDGTPGDSFGNDGVVLPGFVTNADYAKSIALVLQPDGKLVIGGWADIGGGQYDFAIARFEVSSAGR